jgi:hypothetical protein
MKYDIELNLNEQRMALMTLVDMLATSMRGIDRKRNMRLSEKAMAKASFATKIVAIRMAVDKIDAELKAWVHDTGRNQDRLASDRL